MNMPAMLQGPSLTRLLQGAALGFLLTVAVGFNWFGTGFGWVTSGSADKLAAKQSETAVVAVLAPMCAEKFNAQTDVAAKKVALEKASSWDKRQQFNEAWVTLPGTTYPNSDLVELCSKLVLQPKSASK